ncbi:MAG TPA: hypothetical protein VG317_02470 [Pseudonocardiaceae bacterium]|nr:hypothetical protein [Pseudonocardiaceae bacterium]
MTVPLTATRGTLRVLRGVLMAVTSAGLAVSAHAVAGGGLPDTGLTVLLTLVVAAVGVALAGKRLSRLGMLVTLGGSHLGMHLLLTTAATSAGMTAGRVDPTLMLAGHVVAVLLAAVVLTKADSAIFVLAAVWSMLLPRRLKPLPVRYAPPRPPVPGAAPTDRVREVLLRRSRARRGPPEFCGE